MKKRNHPNSYLFLLIAVLVHVSIFTFMSGILCAQDNAQEQLVTDIAVENNNAVNADTILLKIKTGIGRRLIQKQLNEDIKRLYATGFFTDVSVTLEDYKEGVRVIFTVVEKSVVKNIVFQGNDSISHRYLTKEIETKQDDVLNKRVLNSDIRKLKVYYHKKGFPLADVDYRIETDAENHTTVYIIVDEKIKYRIREIKFTGNNAFRDSKLLKQISPRKAAWFRSGILDKAMLKDDLDKIETFYQNNGYIDAIADQHIEYRKEKKEIVITINIEEGLKFTMGKISLKGNVAFTNKQILKEMELTTDEPYNPQQLRADVIKIQTLYFDKGYMNCRVAPETILDKNTQSIDVVYNILEGEIVYVNKIEIIGNTKTKDVVIRRELRLYPGEKYAGEKLRRSKERLYNLGFFEEIIFETEPTAREDKRDLTVAVKEAKTGEFSFGGGYSSVDRLIGFVQVTQKNFDIMNFPTFTGAGQSLALKGTIGSIRRNYELSFTEPWIFGYPLSFGFDLYNLETRKKASLGYGYNEEHLGGSLRLGKEFTDYDRADLKYTLEEVDITDVPEDASEALRDEEGSNAISSLALTLTRDTRNNRFNPIRGYLLSSTLENGGGPTGGDKDFLKMTSAGNAYFNYDEKLVLELQGRLGLAGEYNDSKTVPIYKRFFAGGTHSIRGYKERSIGPRDSATDDPVGGESMLIGNAELTYPVFTNFKVATFYDVGNVWETNDDLSFTDLKTGVGLGVRVNTPIGPVKIDYGFPLDKSDPDDEEKGRFHFSMTRGF